jgi:hypothetical protein
MSAPARIRMDVQCPQIEVRRGEFVTVWLRTDDGSGFDRIQCELRVEEDGTARVYLPPRHAGIVDSFERWQPSGPPGTPKGASPAGDTR